MPRLHGAEVSYCTDDNILTVSAMDPEVLESYSESIMSTGFFREIGTSTGAKTAGHMGPEKAERMVFERRFYFERCFE